MRMIFLLLFGGWGTLFSTALPAPPVDTLISLPFIGSWLLDQDGGQAHWLGAKFQNKRLLEPINVVVVDAFSGSAEEAVNKLLGQTASGGFGERGGHSSGYWATIGSDLFPQISSRDDTAISDGQAFKDNNHGRIFGPWLEGSKYVFTAAFSRESFHLFPLAHHAFVSFNQARDDFALRLSAGASYRIAGYVPLGNVQNDAQQTTADHDGRLVVLEALR